MQTPLSLPRGVWVARIEGTYRGWTARALAVEILNLRREADEAARFDPTTRWAVDLVAGERLRLAQSELQRRLAGQFA